MDKQAFSILEANEFLTVLAYSFDIFMITSVLDENNFFLTQKYAAVYWPWSSLILFLIKFWP